MLNSTDDADDVAEWLTTTYQSEFGGKCTQVIHTKNNGESRNQLRSYEPDFVAIDNAETNWLLESKGQENLHVARKDVAATRWCENATSSPGSDGGI